jgi:Na+/H+ antiporter NhaD/arsenite permease-like protein
LEAGDAARWQYLTIAMASTLAGNLTLVGSIANLIVAERARALGVNVSFFSYLGVGVPITLSTLLIGTLWLAVWR